MVMKVLPADLVDPSFRITDYLIIYSYINSKIGKVSVITFIFYLLILFS